MGMCMGMRLAATNSSRLVHHARYPCFICRCARMRVWDYSAVVLHWACGAEWGVVITVHNSRCDCGRGMDEYATAWSEIIGGCLTTIVSRIGSWTRASTLVILWDDWHGRRSPDSVLGPVWINICNVYLISRNVGRVIGIRYAEIEVYSRRL